ncbi:isoprenyl transferase [uncultured Brachyspira sp.]|uniref:isoprenyl transferase n=1 Tax=uncultured Brachyspira sp. TaxID=221953 RepID=UPI0025E181E8|nr:isoprenyl transferase [uncultured Brachyspira sp.]
MIKDEPNIPVHVAVIMDGNGRWAKTHNKSRSFGHRAGSENVINIVEVCCELEIKYLTLYAFSTENWKRPEEEKKALFKLLKEFYKKEIKRLISNNILVKHIGDIKAFPKDTITAIEETENETSEKCKDPRLTVILALNYGFRDELKNALKNICIDLKNNKIDIENINDDFIKNYLYTKDIPDPDLIIRTSGESRLSNFLMYQASYSELYFTDILWPDFSKEDFKKAVEAYSSRNRRYGGL